MHKEFINFIKKFAIIGTAIGLTTGSAVKSLVDSLSQNLINPFIGLFLSGTNLDSMEFVINNSHFKYGAFVGDVINFIIIMVVVFLIIKFVITKFFSENELSAASK